MGFGTLILSLDSHSISPFHCIFYTHIHTHTYPEVRLRKKGKTNENQVYPKTMPKTKILLQQQH